MKKFILISMCLAFSELISPTYAVFENLGADEASSDVGEPSNLTSETLKALPRTEKQQEEEAKTWVFGQQSDVIKLDDLQNARKLDDLQKTRINNDIANMEDLEDLPNLPKAPYLNSEALQMLPSNEKAAEQDAKTIDFKDGGPSDASQSSEETYTPDLTPTTDSFYAVDHKVPVNDAMRQPEIPDAVSDTDSARTLDYKVPMKEYYAPVDDVGNMADLEDLPDLSKAKVNLPTKEQTDEMLRKVTKMELGGKKNEEKLTAVRAKIDDLKQVMNIY